MKKIFTLLCATALTAAAMQAKVVYVATDGNDANDGLSWDNAVATIQQGLNKAAAGDQVWVAGGTYVITAASPITNTAFINWMDGIDIYGGFKKGDTSIEARVRPDATNEPYNFANPTVITSNGVTLGTRLLNHGPKSTLDCDPCVIDGIKIDKYVTGVTNNAHLAANTTFRNSIVSNCKSTVAGTVLMYVEGNGLIENCLFENNQSSDADMFFVVRIQEAANTKAPNTVKNCIFRNNSQGYSLQVYKTAGGTGTSYVQGNKFLNNNAGCIAISSTPSMAGLVIEGNLFEGNKSTVNAKASSYGVAISGSINAPCVIANNIIRNNENTAEVQGTPTAASIISINSSTMEFIDNLVYNNKSNNYCVYTSGLVLNNTFANNIGTNTVATSCTFPVMNNLYVGNVGSNDRKAFVADSESPVFFLYNGVENGNYTLGTGDERNIGTITDVDASVFVNPTTVAGIVDASALADVDFSLKAGSKASDAGCVTYYDEDNETYLPQIFLGYIDGEETFEPAVEIYKKDLAGNARVVNDKISLGCYQGPAASGIDNIVVDNNENAPVEYYNLQGVRVANPAAGHLYIKRQGNKASKVIL